MQRYQHPIERIIIFSPAAGFTLWQQDFQGNRIYQKGGINYEELHTCGKQTLYSLSHLEKRSQQESKPTETARQVYNRAWHKFRKHLLTN